MGYQVLRELRIVEQQLVLHIIIQALMTAMDGRGSPCMLREVVVLIKQEIAKPE